MFAGAPRVLASLWKVDDAAAKALMVEFYRRWKDGKVGAAAALRAAQDHVRDTQDAKGAKKWSHPRYWAAWVLWGLPD
jgi:CHAT domain-containing protein